MWDCVVFSMADNTHGISVQTRANLLSVIVLCTNPLASLIMLPLVDRQSLMTSQILVNGILFACAYFYYDA